MFMFFFFAFFVLRVRFDCKYIKNIRCSIFIYAYLEIQCNVRKTFFCNLMNCLTVKLLENSLEYNKLQT